MARDIGGVSWASYASLSSSTPNIPSTQTVLMSCLLTKQRMKYILFKFSENLYLGPGKGKRCQSNGYQWENKEHSGVKERRKLTRFKKYINGEKRTLGPIPIT